MSSKSLKNPHNNIFSDTENKLLLTFCRKSCILFSTKIMSKGSVDLKHGIRKKIVERISSLDDGCVFVVGDFSDIAESKTASKTLARLCEEKSIEKLMRGVYRKSTVEKVEPDTIAKALARENAWKSIPCGKTALHLSGLTKEKPSIWTYVSDGTYRTYSVMGYNISFSHTTVRGFNMMSEKTAMIVEILRAYGENAIPYSKLKSLFSYLKPSEIAEILSETKNCPKWIYLAIKKLFMHQNTVEEQI